MFPGLRSGRCRIGNRVRPGVRRLRLCRCGVVGCLTWDVRWMVCQGMCGIVNDFTAAKNRKAV
ncbi:hypothetical protein NEIELOOT_00698 [Neisseria elongata subsp. glycolytica ATCC 29315]|uniref:Uncharacterized protein n=1 Tax=Neisseria elongata subsp. glycolytica ATCC 29315 TaxID=546263 RepID=D4DNR4_NEIEG|nr:hypothetical protein NEIELOOT_00698 [Neisseria elongata subsp. glycolytica ATCC 29315]